MTIPEAVDSFRAQADETDDDVDAARLLDIATYIDHEDFKDAQREVRSLPESVQSEIDEEVWEWLMDDEEQP